MCAEKHNGSTDDTLGTGKNAAMRADGITSKTNAGGINQNLLHLVSSIQVELTVRTDGRVHDKRKGCK